MPASKCCLPVGVNPKQRTLPAFFAAMNQFTLLQRFETAAYHHRIGFELDCQLRRCCRAVQRANPQDAHVPNIQPGGAEQLVIEPSDGTRGMSERDHA